MKEYEAIKPSIQSVLGYVAQRLTHTVDASLVADHRVIHGESSIKVTRGTFGTNGTIEVLVRMPKSEYVQSKSVHSQDRDACAGRHVLGCADVEVRFSSPAMNGYVQDVTSALDEERKLASLVDEAGRMVEEMLSRRICDIGSTYRNLIGEEP